MTSEEVRKTQKGRAVRRIAFGLVVLIIVGGVASWIAGGQLIAPRNQSIGIPPEEFPATSFTLHSESGSTIQGWHLVAEKSDGVVVLLHPIGGSRRSMLGRALLLKQHGYSVVMIDLQAHGESSGDEITLGHREKHDASAAVEFAREKHPGEPIGVIGVSLGGASALFASPLDIDALVLESVYPDVQRAVHNRVAARLGALATIPTELLLAQLQPRLGISASDLRPIDSMPEVGCPVFVISGDEDAHTTASETEEMFHAAKEPKSLWLVDGAAHVNLHEAATEEYEQRVLEFLERHLRGIK